MNKPLSIALAAAIAASAVSVTAAPASAGPKHKPYNHQYNNSGLPLALFGAIAGGIALSRAYQPNYYYYYPAPPPYPYYQYRQPYYGGYYGGGYSAHVQWCLDRYRTYNPATNTYFRKPGVPAVCYSPFG